MKDAGLSFKIKGQWFDTWTSAEVTRDLKDFAGSFSASFYDASRSIATFPFASPPAIFRLEPGMPVEAYADGQLVLVGQIKTVKPDIDETHAAVEISGEDKAGDLIDCAAMPDGPSDLRNVRLEDAATRICQPFGLSVRSEIDTGKPFDRYSIDVAEFAHHAIEKHARQRHALVMSDGVGGVVVTRSGQARAPAGLTLPGNVLGSGATFTHEGRHSEVIVRGQSEKAEGRRDGRAAAFTADDEPVDPGDREDGDGSATERERRGTAVTGRAYDDEIGRYRPIVHLARTKASQEELQDEADWRMRTRRAECEEASYRVAGFGVGARLWRVNELAFVSDAFQGIERDMLISRVTFREDDTPTRETELGVSSPEAFAKGEIGSARTNLKRSSTAVQTPGDGGLDGTAEAL